MTLKAFCRIVSARSFIVAAATLASLALQAFDTPYLTFRSASSFTITSKTVIWDGTLEYSIDTVNWTAIAASSTMTAVESSGQYYIYMRGKGNSVLNPGKYESLFTLAATEDVYCEGDIETLRAYDNVDMPTMGSQCYKYMFGGWTRLASLPTFSATSLASQCYMRMFQDCTSLKTLPELPATTAADGCYWSMFEGCSGIEINSDDSGDDVTWSVPSGFGEGISMWNYNMFSGTGGDFTGNPVAGKTYYIASALPPGLSVKTGADQFAAYVGESVDFNLADTIKGGTGVYTFAGAVPSGLTLNPNGTVSGSIASADTYNFTLRVTDTTSPDPLVLDAAYTLTITAPDPLSASTDLGTVKVGKAKEFNLSDTISGGVPPYTFASTGSLPSGFSLTGDTLSFSAAVAGDYACTITVTDKLGTTLSPSPVYTVVAVESAGYTDDDPDEPDSGVTVDCLTPDGVFPRTCNQVASSSTAVTWNNSWYYVTGDVTLSAGVTVVGKVSLILADGATLTVQAPMYNAGINVAAGNSLTVYSQSGGSGTLTVTSGMYGAGIGGSQNESAGTINIYGGGVTANASSRGAGIGGGRYGNGGTVTINGGVVTATGGFSGAGIGGGESGNGGTVTVNRGTVSGTGGYYSAGIGAGQNGNGGTVTINGGTVNATGYDANTPGIGAYGSYSQGTLTVGANVVVKAGASENPTTELPHGSGGAIALQNSNRRYYVVTTTGPAPLAQTTSAFNAVVGTPFEMDLLDTISGGTAGFTFELTSGELPAWLTRSGTTLSGTPTAKGTHTFTYSVHDSGSPKQSISATYTITVTTPPQTITYMDGATELTGLTPATYIEGTGATLSTSATKTGYTFAGWYANSGLTGDPVTAIGTEATGPQTFWANWTPVEYTITYRDGSSVMFGLLPTKYTIESGATLPATATKEGYEFVAWYANSTHTGSSVTSIAAGTTGNRTFYAKWIAVKSNESYIDADGNPQTELSSPIDSSTTSLESGWYIVKGNVAINSAVTVSGDVKLILADGANLTVTPTDSDSAGINVAAGNSLSIYVQSGGTGSLAATAVQTGNGAGIGGKKSEACGSVTIYGGNVTATGGFYGAGIGGGRNGAGGTVAIYGGTVTATGVSYGAGIGGGYYGSGGTIMIEGGTVTATSSNSGAGIGGGNYGAGGTVTISGGTVTATGGSSTSSISGYIASGIGKGYGSSTSYTDGTLTVDANMKAYVGSSANPTAELGSNRSYRYYEVKAGPLAQSVSAIEANAGEPCDINLAETVVGGSGTYTFALKAGSELPPNVEIVDNTTLSGTVANVGTYTFTLVVTDTTTPTPQTIDAEYTLTVKLPGYIEDDPAEPASGVEVDCRTADGKVRRRMCNQVVSSSAAVTWDNSWYYVTGDVTLSAGVTVNGKVSLVLADDATLTVSGGSSSVAGINVVIANSVTNSLTIYGQTKGNGSLTATAGGDNGAGIGGGNGQKGGKVNVYGGSIKATGGYYGSGIGGGRSGAGGVVSVYGGTIEATAGDVSSGTKPVGIGSGYSNSSKGDFYIFSDDMTVKAGSSATGSLTKLTPNATTHKVTVSTYKYFIVTGPLPMSQKTSSLGTALTGQQKSWNLSTSTYIVDGKAPYTFDPENSTIPEGFSLTTAGVLSGRPSAAGNCAFTVSVSDAMSSTSNFVFTLTVNDPAPITVATTDYGSIAKGTSFYQTISPSGGVSPYTFSSAGGRPAGISFYTEAGVGVLSGSCSTPGDYKFTITITDSAVPANVKPIEFSLSVKDVYAITYYDEDGETPLSLSPATYVQDAGVATLPTPEGRLRVPELVRQQGALRTARDGDSGHFDGPCQTVFQVVHAGIRKYRGDIQRCQWGADRDLHGDRTEHGGFGHDGCLQQHVKHNHAFERMVCCGQCRYAPGKNVDNDRWRGEHRPYGRQVVDRCQARESQIRQLDVGHNPDVWQYAQHLRPDEGNWHLDRERIQQRRRHRWLGIYRECSLRNHKNPWWHGECSWRQRQCRHRRQRRRQWRRWNGGDLRWHGECDRSRRRRRHRQRRLYP